MQSKPCVAVISTEVTRRQTISCELAAAGFQVTAASTVAELSATEGTRPLAVVIDRMPAAEAEAAAAEARSRWPNSAVWTVCETVRRTGPSAGPDVIAEGAEPYPSPQVVIEAALARLAVAPRARIGKYLFDNDPDPVFVVSSSLTIVRANKAFCERIGRKAEDLVGRHCVEIMHGLLEPWNECLLERALDAPSPIQWKLPDVALGAPYDCTTIRVVFEDGSLGAAHHLRESGESGATADDGVTTLGRVTASIIHELNNPLCALLGFAEVLEESGSCPPEFKADLRQMQHEAWRCRRIIGNLLTLARNPEPRRVPTDIHELIDRAITVRSYQREHERVRILRDFAAYIPPVLVDPDHIEQILINLLANAQEAVQQGRRGGSVTVSTEAAAGELVIAVADDGPGIPPDKLPLLFTALFTTKGSGKGTGLGLNVSRMLARQHGGDILAENREGGGALFTVRIPLIPAGNGEPARNGDAAATGAPSPQSRNGRINSDTPGKVLVVDDEGVVRDLLTRILRADGHTVVACPGFDQAAREVESSSFDVIIADLSLLQSAGQPFLEDLRKQHIDPASRLILTSGRLAGHEPPAAGWTANPILPKPFSSDQVARSVRAVLRPGTGG